MRTPAIFDRVGQVASDRMLATTFRSISSSIEVETSSKEKIGSGGRLDLHRDGLGDTEPVIGGLQPGIVEERDLHRGIGAERCVKQARDFALRERGILGGADPHHVFVQPSAGDRRDRAHPAVGREGSGRLRAGRALAMARARPKI